MNLWQKLRGLVGSPDGRGLLTGSGGCCCGQTCACRDDPVCGATGGNPQGVRSSGKFFAPPPSTTQPYAYETFEPTDCCCYRTAPRGLMRGTRDRVVTVLSSTNPGQCLGVISRNLEEISTPNANSGTVQYRQRIWGVGAGCVQVLTLDQTQTKPLGCPTVNSPAPFAEPLTTNQVPTTFGPNTLSLTGTFSIDCETLSIKWKHVYRSTVVGFTTVFQEAYSETAYVERHDEANCGQDPDCFAACCLPNGECRQDLSEVECLGMNGVPNAAGTSCFNANCDAVTNTRDKGACCDPATGNCVMSAPEGCVAPRVFKGIGTICQANTCPQPTGACCNGALCTTTQQATCLQAGGIWTQGATCGTPGICEQFGACCLPDGSCQDTSMTNCLNQAGVFRGSGTSCAGTLCTGACCTAIHGGAAWDCAQTTPQGCASFFYGIGSVCGVGNSICGSIGGGFQGSGSFL